jgi:hypothetical protein
MVTDPLSQVFIHFVEKRPDFHPALYSFIEETLSAVDASVSSPPLSPGYFDILKTRCLVLATSLIKHSKLERVMRFNNKYSDELCAWFVKGVNILVAEPSNIYLYGELTKIVRYLIASVAVGAFEPFRFRYYMWSNLFIFRLDEITPTLNTALPQHTLAQAFEGVDELKQVFFDLHTSFILLLPPNDPFGSIFMEDHSSARNVLVHAFACLQKSPNLCTVLGIYRYIYAALTVKFLFRKLKFFEIMSEGVCCRPKITDPVQLDEDWIEKLKFYVLCNQKDFSLSLTNFWNGKSDVLNDKEGIANTGQSMIMNWMNEYPENDVRRSFKATQIFSVKSVFRMQYLIVQYLALNEYIPADDILEGLKRLFANSKNPEITRALYLIGGLNSFASDHASYPDVGYIARFMQSPDISVRVSATGCLFEMYNCPVNKFNSPAEFLNSVFANICGNDIILSYCSIRLLEVVTINTSEPDRVKVFILSNLGKLIERAFEVMNGVSLFYPLKFLINIFNEENLKEARGHFSTLITLLSEMGTKLLLNRENFLNHSSIDITLFADICSQLLGKFRNQLYLFDHSFDFFFLLFIYLKKAGKNPKEFNIILVTHFDNFIDKVINYIKSKKFGYWEVADLLNSHLPVENVNLLRETIKNSLDDQVQN